MEHGFLSVTGIIKTFGSFVALNNISFAVKEKEFICLLGPSGCGKTTLLRILAGLEQPNNGKILLNGTNITALPPSGRNFGMVFQSYALFPNITAYQNVAYGLQSRNLAKAEIAERVAEALALVNLAHAKDYYPAQLSGGQQQRIALARALVLSPAVLLLDEPLSALDAKVRIKLRQEIRNLQQRLNITTIMVTHDQEEALTMADRVVVMNNALVEQVGTPLEVYEKPHTPFIADFIGSINFFPGEWLAHGRYRGKLLAIRPEHIRVSREGGRGFAARISAVEFRGSFYRLTIRMEDKPAIQGEVKLIADVSAGAMREIMLGNGMPISVELPEERLLSYDRLPTLPEAAG